MADPSSSSSPSTHHTVQNTGASAPSRPPTSTVVAHSQPPQLPSVAPQSKRTRGRPQGSRNKPKPDFSPNGPPESEMKPIIIEVANGTDVVEAVISFARRRHLNLTLLSASGSISQVTLCHALTEEPNFSLHGPLAIMSLSGTYLHNYHFAPPSAANPNPPYCFGLTISASQGQVFGGIIGGRAIAGNGVSVTAITFKNAEVYRANAFEHNMDGNNGMNNNNHNEDNDNNPNAFGCGAAGNSGMVGFNVPVQFEGGDM